MKLKSLFLLLIVFLVGSVTVQAQNPYKEFGIEVKPLTLSNGKYIEFFTNDSLVRIGSIILDTRNNRISSFVQRDTMYSEANLEPEVSSRFLSLDPHAASYPDLSPYTYAANNPLYYTDPDGRDIVIHYYDGEEDREFVFNGKNAGDAPDNSFVQSFISAYNYATGNGEGNALREAATNGELSVNLGFSGDNSSARSDWVLWNPNQGFTEGGDSPVISPAISLEHEMDHTVDYLMNAISHKKNLGKNGMPTASNMEEVRVINGTEQSTARSVGEIGPNQRTRATHFSAHPVMTNGATSTTINRRATYNYWRSRYNARKRQGKSTRWEEANMKKYKN